MEGRAWHSGAPGPGVQPRGPAAAGPTQQGGFELRGFGGPGGYDHQHGLEGAGLRDAGSLHKLQRNGSEDHLPYSNRGSLPTVAEDDILSAGGMEMGLEQELELAERLADQQAEPTRTLLVRNVASDAPDEELRSIFQAFGDLRTLYTGSKHRGLLLVVYFDLRAAVSALSTLQGTLIKNMPIDMRYAPSRPAGSGQDSGVNQGMVVVFNLDPDTTNEHLVWLFSKFGEVKDIHESAARPNQKFITFFDVRHAAAALKAMNRAEQLNKLPSHLTPQQVATLQSHTSGPNLMQLAQLQAGGNSDSANNMLQWDPSTSPAAMEGLMHLVKHQQAQAHAQAQGHSPHGTGSALAGSGSGPSTAHPSHPDLQVGAGPSGMPHHQQLPHQHQGGMSHPQYSKYPMEQLAASARALHISDSASSIASVPGSIMVAAAAGGVPKGLPGHLPMGGPNMGRGMGGGGMNNGGMGGGGSGMGGGGMDGAMYNAAAAAAADRQAQQQLQFLQAAETANMLMGLGLGGNGAEQWASDAQAQAAAALGLQGGNNPGMWSNTQAALYAASNQLNNLQELQARQQAVAHVQLQQAQQQQAAQQQVLAQLQAQQALQQAAGAGVGGLGNANNLAAAAQILQAAGLNNVLGAQQYLPGLNASAAAQILQHAGLGIPGLGLAGLQGINAAALQAQLGMLSAARGGMLAGRMLGDAGHNRSGGRLSRRTTDPTAEAERKAQQEKLYALDLDKIARGDDKRTTLMIKNIPNKYTQKMLLATVDEFFKGTYDFFYLPIDFKNKCNVGYAFINMVQPINIIPLVQRFNNKKWERFNSEKVCNISYARIQGRVALVQHFQNSSLMHEDKRCRPILFTLEDGENAGEQEPFPSAGGSGINSSGNSGTKLSGLAGSSNSLRSNGGSSNSLRDQAGGTSTGGGGSSVPSGGGSVPGAGGVSSSRPSMR